MKLKYLISFLLLLAFMTPGFSRVIHRTVNMQYAPTGFGAIDFNEDGMADAALNSNMTNHGSTMFTCPSAPLNYMQTMRSFDYGMNSNSGTSFTQFFGNFLPAGTQIGFNSHTYISYTHFGGFSQIEFTPSNCGGQTIINSNYGPIGQSGYIGIKIAAGAGIYYFGWMRLSGYSIVEVAYESIPGFPIVTGDKIGYVSEPGNPIVNTVKGKIYADADASCSFNAGEAGIRGIYVFLVPGNYGAMTDEKGNYEILVPGGTANYSVNINLQPYRGVKYAKVCPTGTLTASFTGNNQVSANNNFAVTTSSCVDLGINISSDRRRRCFRNNTYVRYFNEGTSASPAATVKVIMPKYVKAISSTPAWTNVSGDTLIYSVGILNAFSYHDIHIIDSVICGNENIRGISQCTKAMIGPKSYCYASPGWDQSDLFVKGSCTDSDFSVWITNSGADMSDSVSYRIFLDGTMVKLRKIKLNAGETQYLTVPVNGKSLHIEVDQPASHPEVSSRSLNYEGCGNFSTETISKKFAEKFPMEDERSIATSCMPIRDSYDPNDKAACPEGFDNDNKILANNDIEYTIRFQNTGNDEAYTVVVADTLDANLDASTLRVTGSSHPYKLEVTGGNTSPRLAWIFGGINLPDKTTNEPGSHGYVKFRVAQKPGLTAGTSLKNKAYIFFDYNSAIITNQVTHKITNAYPQDLLQLTTQPTGSVICEDADVTFSAAGIGSGTVKYQWYKDNNPISGKTNTSLSLNNAATSDAADYKCRITNQIDTIFTSVATLSVNQKPDLQVTDPAASCSVNITNSFTDANATSGTVSYWKNSQATIAVSAPDAINASGIYYIKKQVSPGCSDIAPVNVVVNTCSGILDELKSNFGISVYPNPVSEKLIIDNDKTMTLEILDNEGREVYRDETQTTGEINMRSYPSGIYYLKLTIDGQAYTVPLVKQ